MKVLPAQYAQQILATEKWLAAPIDKAGKGAALYRYSGGAWRPGGEARARTLAATLLDTEATPKLIAEIVELVKEAVKRPESDLNPHALTLLNTATGMLDIATLKVLPHDPAYFSTMQIQAEWDPDAQSDDLDKYLATSIPADALPTLLELVGYSLVPDRRQQIAAILVGGGSNGKGITILMWEGLLGPDLVTHVPLQALADNRFRAAELHGKLLCAQGDIPSTRIQDTSMVKSVIGGDVVQAERKHQHPFDFRSTALCVWSANEIPRTADRTFGWLRRLLIIPFPYKFDGSSPERTPDRTLEAKLASPQARSALLRLAVEGLRRLRHEGDFSDSESIAAAKEIYARSNDSVLAYLSEEWDKAPANHVFGKQAIYDEYVKWTDQNGLGTASKTDFNARIVEVLGVTEGRISQDDRGRAWRGLVRRAD